ncbi:conjugal transfer protein TraX [Salmonella enterica]|nr:conjugal transfer protein TraX [Salmonella enterica]ELT0040233.1 conjugal transfer protein TraX [Salmonella enterica]ELT0107917.1 conjugal transfer protein TraX [Salmonella enterica]
MKMKTGLYWLANIFLPLSEARYTKNKIIPSFAKQLQRMRVAKKLLARRRRQPGLTWVEAVAASGMDKAGIERRQLRRKKQYLAIASVPVLMAVGLFIAVLASGIYVAPLLIRLGIMTVVLVMLGSIPLLQAVVCTWRLWQLREHRVSVEEKGTFTDFRRETAWIRLTLNPWR